MTGTKDHTSQPDEDENMLTIPRDQVFQNKAHTKAPKLFTTASDAEIPNESSNSDSDIEVVPAPLPTTKNKKPSTTAHHYTQATLVYLLLMK